jgi:hypothetical protein
MLVTSLLYASIVPVYQITEQTMPQDRLCHADSISVMLAGTG